MKLITISGLDGSGKSTQIELLKNYLESQGKRVFYFHAIKFGLANQISAKPKTSHCACCQPKMSVSEEKSVTQSSWIGVQLRKIFLMIDLRRFKKLCQKLEKEGYDYLVSDRYFYDSLINIAYLNKSKIPDYNTAKPDIAIYLQINPEIIMQRERKPDQGIEYLKKKDILYSEASKNWGLTTINGDRPKEEIFEDIKKHL